MIKYILLTIALLSLSGCAEKISSNKCKELGYTYGLHNGFNEQIGCKKRIGDMVESYNSFTGRTYTTHITEAGAMYKLED